MVPRDSVKYRVTIVTFELGMSFADVNAFMTRLSMCVRVWHSWYDL